MSTAYGKFFDFCRDSGSKYATIPVCNLFINSPARGGQGFGGCDLTGIPLGAGEVLANLGSIIFSALAIITSLALIFRSNLKRAAVGRREMQMFLVGYLVLSICEIFTVGGFPLNGDVVKAFTAIQVGTVVATAWILMLNAIVGFQFLEDGTVLSIALIGVSAFLFFIGAGYIALDTGFSFTGFWDDTTIFPDRSYSLYTLYLLLPLIFIVIYFILETYLVLRILGEFRPMVYLSIAGLLFALGQIFQFAVSVHICTGTGGKINGGLFEVLFTLLAVIMVWVFWASITEDDWPTTAGEFA